MENIKKEHLAELLKQKGNSEQNKIIRHALSVSSIDQIANSLDNAKDMDFNFDINIKTLEATNQKRSGRCWIFAALNVLREELAKKVRANVMELSQSYVAFYDKLEKLNYALEVIIELGNVDYDDRTLTYILQTGLADGGQWDMFVNIVNKYGVCPKNVFVETFTSSNTMSINRLFDSEFRRFASEVKVLFAKNDLKGLRALKDSYLDRFYLALTNTYGLTPEKFDFEYTDKDNVYHLEKGYTPLSFYEKYFKDFVSQFVSLINAPTKTKPFGKTYTIKYLNNVVGGADVIHLNVSMERMKELILMQLKDNQIVWFGSDVSFYGERTMGLWDDDHFDYRALLDLDHHIDKGEGLDYRVSAMNHAMCLTGVCLKDNKPAKWKVENSWGTVGANKGYYLMSSSWFDKYVYQAVVNRKYLNEKEQKALKEKPVVLVPWDPMGALAD